MTLTEMQKWVGKRGYIRHGELRVHVEIKDVKQVYGRTRYHVEPVAGFGRVWIDEDSLILREDV